MATATIRAEKRQNVGSRAARRLRVQGLLPAVLYGHGMDPVHLTLPLKDLERLVGARTRMVGIEVEGAVETALLKDLQYDSLGDHLLHVDLARVAMDETVTVTVPVELHGLAKGASSGGVLDHLVQDIMVRCLPGDIPERIRVEIAALDVGQIIHIRDLPPPPGVEFVQDPETPVVTVHQPIEAKEAAPVEEAAAPAEPEVLSARREAEEEEENEG
jgi:large subunit ribosomal protein L25